jgi:hypothetical protein
MILVTPGRCPAAEAVLLHRAIGLGRRRVNPSKAYHKNWFAQRKE